MAPVDDEEDARLIISVIILNTFKTLEIRHPEVDVKRRHELPSIPERLMKEECPFVGGMVREII